MGRGIEELIDSFNLDRLTRTVHGYKACCSINPAHQDSKPSMHIHIEKGLVKCFSCGTFRFLFDFLLENGATFDEAVEFLFLKHDWEDDNDSTELKDYVLGRKLPKSFLDRGFEKETLRHFEVGYDEYEDRITMPLRFNGKLIGIQYRRYPKDIWGTENFNKFNYIYNYEPTEERTYVEGLSDCWRTWQNGTKKVSSTLTANISEGQLSLMAQHKIINIAFDNDLAGMVGAFKIQRALRGECEINMIPYNEKDPGDCTEEQWLWGMKNKTTFTAFEVSLITNKPNLYADIMKRIKNK